MYQENKNIKAKKYFGQNFLKNKAITKKIVDLAEITSTDSVIEIGPGKGALTKEILKKTKDLIVFEIDKDMQNYLIDNEILKTEQIILGDFLKAELSDFKNSVVIGNIPYYITSEIIFKILDNRFLFKKAILMVQKEVADRIVAKANSSEYSKLSVTCQYVAEVKKLLVVPKKEFDPVPNVDSAIISFNFYQKENDNFDELKNFFKLIFSTRRKKLSFSLKQYFNKEKILDLYNKMNLSENIRVQELSLNQMVEMYYLLNEK
ncbi:16S rRNA (adenine(1518)-N(6)/adenine(1519)-N(6))-dimethyltransferase RsmA [Mycoplasmopsis gallinarum]|uniref:Ribosomal RNA small subunit methyltransferase A n=1 Tax=Mycoplasmopsis gallinarum TaxID=29557 RepID=A0A168RLN8_9BACT|nr:16S rRNA (adenine(1518)-N(6)/adenine(1519)-N(6))-dimethyltransferase RsmA [Mycoplasmopsis gallinarum]OAB49099.1 SSU rRNA(adenine(1518)-N(6)/adenine(1519)-N(6))-dimethyltransferase [Mycoplasmopsis gallinarum]